MTDFYYFVMVTHAKQQIQKMWDIDSSAIEFDVQLKASQSLFTGVSPRRQHIGSVVSVHAAPTKGAVYMM